MPSKRNGSAKSNDEEHSTKRLKLDVNSEVYDSDDEPPPSESDHLNWRLDPEESHSDWTIQVTSLSSSLDIEGDTSNVEETYHVHKHMIAVGAKKCEYFCRLFRNSFAESCNSTSCIKLEKLAADAFPTFLDYMYSPQKDELKITTQNATALHYLSKYFENRRLRWLVKQFWSTDIDLETCGTYFSHATLFHDEKILNAIAKFCTLQIESITPESPVIQNATLEFMLSLLKASEPRMSKHMSTLVARYCSDHKDISLETFLELTKEQSLPVVDCHAAIDLMAVENQFSVYKNSQQLSDLQKRCADALSDHLVAVDLSSSQYLKSMNELNPRVLMNVLSSAQGEIQRLKRENQRLMAENHHQSSENQRLKKEIECQKTTNEIFVSQNRTLNNEITCLTSEKDALLNDIEGLSPVPPDGILHDSSTCQEPQEVTSLPSFDRNRNLKRHVFYQTRPFTNILGEKVPGQCYALYYFKNEGY